MGWLEREHLKTKETNTTISIFKIKVYLIDKDRMELLESDALNIDKNEI